MIHHQETDNTEVIDENWPVHLVSNIDVSKYKVPIKRSPGNISERKVEEEVNHDGTAPSPVEDDNPQPLVQQTRRSKRQLVKKKVKKMKAC